MTRFVLFVLLMPAWAQASVNTQFEKIDWDTEGSIFECRLSQMLPEHGQAVFYREAGESQQFFVDTKTAILKAGKGALKVMGPVWKPHAAAISLGYIDVVKSKRPVSLGARLSTRLLAELDSGQQLQITRRAWYGGAKSIKLAVSPINFQRVYGDYQNCVSSLLPVNFGQVEKSILLFKGRTESLTGSQRARLDSAVIYAKADNEVRRFYIDGHTDNIGVRAENLELSKSRAELVADYLMTKGIGEDKIITRWHGERYPVASNRTTKGRIKNRRVTVRLEKGGEPEDKMPPSKTVIPDMAAK